MGEIAELSGMIQAFCEQRNWDQFHGPKDLACGLITEASELLELFRFQSEEQCRAMLEDPAERQKMGEELADALFFVLRFAQMYRFDLKAALVAKMERNAQKYPVHLAKNSNKKYDQL